MAENNNAFGLIILEQCHRDDRSLLISFKYGNPLDTGQPTRPDKRLRALEKDAFTAFGNGHMFHREFRYLFRENMAFQVVFRTADHQAEYHRFAAKELLEHRQGGRDDIGQGNR